MQYGCEAGGIMAIDDLALVRASLREVQADGAGNDERVLFIVGKPDAIGLWSGFFGLVQALLNFSPVLNTVEMCPAGVAGALTKSSSAPTAK